MLEIFKPWCAILKNLTPSSVNNVHVQWHSNRETEVGLSVGGEGGQRGL